MKKNIIPYGKHEIVDEDIEAVSKILKSNFITQGPTVASFENDFSKYVGSKFAVAVSNGTAALHLAALALKLQPGDIVIVPAITFLATANAIRYVGAEVAFADVDAGSGLITAQHIYELLEKWA